MAITMGTYVCPHCNESFTMEASQYNHRLKNKPKKGPPKIYCSKTCSGLARRTSKAEKIEAKRLYDIEYREKNKESLKKKNQEYNSSPAGRAMQKRARDKKKDYHLEYCRTPEYRAWKREYDQKRVFIKMYGESEWHRKKTCLICQKTKPVKQFVYNQLCPDNRMHLCVSCEKEQAETTGMTTSYVLTVLGMKSPLTRADFYEHPMLIEAKRQHLVLIRELRHETSCKTQLNYGSN